MKTKFKWLVIVFALLLSASTLFVACHKHEYGEWTVKIAPTETTAGTAERKCKDGDDAEEVELKPLSDTSFWTVSETAATHVADGSKKYTSAYVTVTITLPKLAHTFGDWTITVEPTLEAGGTAKRTCTANDGGEDTVTLPTLSDTSVWTEKSSTPANHTTAGSAVYTSAYGEVTITLPKVAHTFGDWIITSEPTLEAGGTAKRTCSENDGGEETAALPALSDTSVWTVEKRTNPTHVDTGSAVYASEYGKVTVTLPKIAHTFDGARWEIRTAPTKTSAGVAVRYCTANDGGEETVALPVLTDTSFWTATSVDASYNESGGIRYTSAYVTVFEEDSSKPKLVAPYDSKTYYPLGFMAGANDYNKVCAVQTSWNKAELALDEKGSDADSSAYPFMGGTKVTMVDPSTGEVSINIAGDVFKGYVDMSGKTDFIVMLHNNYVFLLTTEYKTEIVNVGADADEGIEGTPTEVKSAYSTSTTPIASSWTVGVNTAMAITYEGKSGTGVNIFVYNDTVVFGVDFNDMSGSAVAADMCFDASCVYVIKNDEKLHGFGHDGEKMNILDGKEGVYAPEDTSSVQGTIVISGFGKITLEDVEGTYTVGENSIEAFIGGVFYNVNLLEGNKHRTEAPQITLHFNAGENGAVTPEQKTYGIKVVAELPVPTTSDSSLIFVGWAFDEAGTQLVPRDFKPEREHNTKTLYAVWKGKVTFTVTVDGNTETIYGAEGDVIGNLLPVIEKIDEENRRQFMGWEAAVQGSTDYRDLNTASVLNAQYNGLSIRAKWEALAAYYGEYKGSSIRSGVYGTGYTLKIDENGNIVGDYDNNLGSADHTEIRGKVSGYNKDTQLITWQSDADNSIHYFMFDEASGVLLIDYQLSSTISTSFTAFVMDGDVNDVSAFRILAANYNSAHSRLLVISDGTTLVLDDRIHSNVGLENAYGEAITFADFDNFMNEKRTQVGTYSFTIVVKAAGNEVVLARGVKITVALVTSSGSGSYGDGEGDYGDGEDYDDGETTTTLKTEETWYDLDAVYGVYTAAGETLKLDGMGGMVYGEKSGTYAAVSGNIYDVYLANRSEYYRMTLDTSAKTATMEFVEVDVNLDLGDVTLEGFETSKRVNINVPYDLPVPNASAQKKYFGGWFTDAAHENAVATNDEGQYLVTLTGDTTFYALWHEAVTLTVVYNNGEADGSFELPWNTKYALPVPEFVKHKFVGWFTTENFASGSEWISDETLVDKDITVYAKWENAPIYNETYTPTDLESRDGQVSGTTKTYGRTHIHFNIDVYGKTTCTAYPFSGSISIENYNSSNGTLEFQVTKTNGSIDVFHGFIDTESKIIILGYNANSTAFDAVFLLNPFEQGNIPSDRFSSSYWDNGNSRAIQYTYDDTTYSIFVHDGHVYFGVSFKDAATGGSDVSGADCYTKETLYVFDSENALIAKFAKDGDNGLVALDGFEGTYGGDSGSLVVNGVNKVTLNGVGGTYVQAAVKGTIGAYVGEGNERSYYEIVLDSSAYTYTITKPMVNITLSTSLDTATAATVSGEKNINIGIELPELSDANNVFRGWYTSSDFASGTKIEKTDGKYLYTPTVGATIYAKWDPYVTLTMVYGKGLENRVDRYGAGDTITPVDPPFTDGQVFEAWYADAALTTPWNETSISVNTIIYCKWMDAVAMYGDYKGFNLYYNSTGHGSGSTTTSFSQNLTITAGGIASGNKSGTVRDYASDTGIFYIDKDATTTYYAVYNEECGAVIFAYGTNATGLGTDTNLFFKDGTVSKVAYSIDLDVDKSKFAKLITVTFTTGTNNTKTLLLLNDRLYSSVKVEIKDANGNTVTLDVDKITASAVSELKISDKNDNQLLKLVSNGTELKFADGSEGTYTCEGMDNLVLNGAGIARLGEVVGTYTKAAEDVSYDYDMYIGTGSSQVYYRVSLSGNTYTAVNPTATITFDLGGKGTNITYNQSLNVTLDLRTYDVIEEPTADGFVFRGWYAEAGGTGSRVWEVKPTDETPKTVYAKWDAAVTLTVVYGNGMETKTVTKYYANDTVSLNDFEQPSTELINDLAFEGWYTDDTFENKYTAGVITESMAIYGKWVTAHVMFGEYKGWNFYNNNAEDRAGSSLSVSATVSAAGVLKDNRITNVNIDDAEGDGIYFAGSSYIYFNEDEGIFGHAYSNNISTGFNNDMMLFFRKEVSKVYSSQKLDSSKGNLEGGRLMFVEYADGTSTTLYIDNTQIISGVTWIADGVAGEGSAVKTAASAGTLTVTDKSGTVLFTK